MNQVPQKILKECKNKLLTAKSDLLNKLKESRANLSTEEKGGDEGDQTVRVLLEADMLNRHERIRTQLLEIESALARIEQGTFGVCEETEEPIESDRLLAIPWTRLSIEGAEIRESVKARFAR